MRLHHRPIAWLLLGGALSALSLGLGLIARSRPLVDLPDDAGRLGRLLTSSLGGGFRQIGFLGLVIVAFLTGRWLLGRMRGRPPRPVRAANLRKLCIPILVAFLGGELFLRAIFWNGMSFGHHHGPMVRRFERGFRFNRFDGPSRGPDTIGRSSRDAVRLLVQGDSITWGQGVQDERLLYTARLLDRVRQNCPETEMAVLASAGREIDVHLEQLRTWGGEIDPDVIIYQWYYNDLEIDKSQRPGKRDAPPWRRLFFHYLFAEYSYLWFFVDDRLALIWPSGSESFADCFTRTYGDGTPGWLEFERLFRAWAEEALRLTPRVIVALYPPNPGFEEPFAMIYLQMTELARDVGVEVIDLGAAFSAVTADLSTLDATPFDAHPGAEAHRIMADALYDHLAHHPRFALCKSGFALCKNEAGLTASE